MITRGKLILGAISAVLVAVVAALAWSALGAQAYFEGGRCTCGKDIFIYQAKQDCLTYSPGHGIPYPRAFQLRARGDEWELVAAPGPRGSWPAAVKAGDVLGTMRLQDGALYISWKETTRWTRHARIANPWRIWLARATE